ncbi:hypothetical protein EVAR_7534_1 [Eumeta japonica]|uniref:Uncharacterized protein n=1 Tax=Eumeta variegata TaxID=151549 RepID=A0A4C1VRV1_EUMVA|nr:hypothetical protein EVAR_7534_1 [Eumeta japonica]
MVASQSSVRSPAPNGRYRAPAPSALTKLFALCRSPPATLPALPIESQIWLPNGVNEVICSEPRRWPFPFRERQTRTDLGPPALEVLSPIPGVARPPSIIPHSILRTPFARSIADLARIRLLGPLAEHPIVCSHTCPSSSENSAGRPRRLLFAPTNNRRLIRHLRKTGNCTIKRARLPWTKIPLLPWGRVWPKTPITLEFIQQVLTKALSEIGYEAPQDVVKTNRESDPVSSRASSRATSPMKTNKIK